MASVDGPVVLAIDGNSLVHRSYHAQAGSGQPSWAVRGLLTQLVAAVDRLRPSAVVVGFDDPDRSDRRERWPEYKAHRAEKLDTLVEQLAEAAEAIRSLGVAVVVPPGLEADDVLASTVAFARERGERAVVVTSDRDAFALIDRTTSVLRIINGGVEASPLLFPDRLFLMAGIWPHQYRDLAALRGDASDNLCGVRGIGPRTGVRLLAEFESASAAFDDLPAVRAALGPGVATRLGHPDARPTFERNCAVMAMRADVPITVSPGAGVLPLAAAAVEAQFRSHNLTWTTRRAVQVLAGVDPGPPRVEPAYAPAASWAAPRFPPLPPKPATVQLSLFE